MKVFITWSGPTSRKLAEAFRDWLPSVIQAVKPYFSPEDVAKGSRWYPEISKQLEESKVGLICLTRDNLDAPWLLFEAGALSKSLEKSRVCPILFGIEPTDVKDPLAQFQCARFDKPEIARILKMLNQQLGDEALAADVLKSVFDMWWPRLEHKVQEAMSSVADKNAAAVRTERELLEEILGLTRGASQGRIADLATEELYGLVLAGMGAVRDVTRTVALDAPEDAWAAVCKMVGLVSRLADLTEDSELIGEAFVMGVRTREISENRLRLRAHGEKAP